MKKILFYSLALVVLVSFSSCSTDSDDDLNPDKEIIGVWEQEGFGLIGDMDVERLLFEPDNTYFIISKTVFDDDHVISTINSYQWELNGNAVSILGENNDVIETFTLNSDGQLISSNSEEPPYHKISDTTSGYY